MCFQERASQHEPSWLYRLFNSFQTRKQLPPLSDHIRDNVHHTVNNNTHLASSVSQKPIMFAFDMLNKGEKWREKY